MASLFIIGNGFDLAHGMATKYNNFRRYLADNHCSSHHWGLYVPETVTGHHGEELQSDDEVVELIMYLIDAVAPFDYERNEVDWNNIETLLGAVDLTECFDTVEEQYDREGDRNYLWERDNAAIVCDHVSLAVPRISEFFQSGSRQLRFHSARNRSFRSC